jgi:hypothetical protein
MIEPHGRHESGGHNGVHRDARLFAQLRQQIGVGLQPPVDLAALECGRDSAGIGQDVPLNTVEMGNLWPAVAASRSGMIAQPSRAAQRRIDAAASRTRTFVPS